MSDIVKVTEEEFDDEGNLVRRVITEYGVEKKPTVLPNPPWGQGQIVSYSDQIGKYQLWNGPVKLREFEKEYDVGTFARSVPGGTDKDGYGQVSSQTTQQLADNGED